MTAYAYAHLDDDLARTLLRRAGLDDIDAQSLSADRMDELFGQYRAHDITDEETFKRLAAEYGLEVAPSFQAV